MAYEIKQEFEQAGEDRAQYDQRLMHTLAQALGDAGCQGLSPWRETESWLVSFGKR